MKTGDRVYYIISGRTVRPAVIKGIAGNSCFLKHSSGVICLPKSRLYMSEEEAEKHLIPKTVVKKDYSLSSIENRIAYDCCGKPDP